MSSPLPPTLLSTARAWFPEPEFKCVATQSFHTFSTLLRIVHVESRVAVDQCIDEDRIPWLDHFMECAAGRMHMALAKGGFGQVIRIGIGPFRHWILDDRVGVQALFDLMNLKLIFRECQGYQTFADDGKVLYLVKVGAWAQPVKAGSLDNPLPYWQNIVSSLIQQEQRA